MLYKVCIYHNHKYVSYDYNNPFVTEYKVGQITYPPIGKLFAFTNIYYVNIFINSINNYHIFECKGEIADVDHNIRSHTAFPTTSQYKEQIHKFWNGQSPSKHLYATPSGSIYCNWIQLTKSINRNFIS